MTAVTCPGRTPGTANSTELICWEMGRLIRRETTPSLGLTVVRTISRVARPGRSSGTCSGPSREIHCPCIAVSAGGSSTMRAAVAPSTSAATGPEPPSSTAGAVCPRRRLTPAAITRSRQLSTRNPPVWSASLSAAAAGAIQATWMRQWARFSSCATWVGRSSHGSSATQARESPASPAWIRMRAAADTPAMA